MNFVGPVPGTLSICGVCDCNLISILSFLLGIAFGLVTYFILRIASDRKREREEQ